MNSTIMSTAISTIVVILFFLLFLVATVTNTLILVVLYRRPSLRSTSNRLISSLSVTNLLSSYVLLPLVVLDTISPALLSDDVCRPLDAVAMFVITSSVFATVIIAVDKFCAVEDPLRYHAVMTPGRAALLVAVGWSVSLASAAASTVGERRTRGWQVCRPRQPTDDPLDHSDEYRDNRHWVSTRRSVVMAQTAAVFLLPLLILSWIYFSISRAAQKSSRRARACSQPPTPGGCQPPPPPPRPEHVVAHLRQKWSSASGVWRQDGARAAKVSVLVVVLFACCYLPYFALELIRVGITRAIPSVYTHVSLIFVLSNAALAPFLYSLRSQKMQAELRRLFARSPVHALHRVRVIRRSPARRNVRQTVGSAVSERPTGREPDCSQRLCRPARSGPARPGRTRFDWLGFPTSRRDSSLESEDTSGSSTMTSATAVSLDETDPCDGPLHHV